MVFAVYLIQERGGITFRILYYSPIQMYFNSLSNGFIHRLD